jgi:hypothetical protein
MADVQTGRGDPPAERPASDERVSTSLKVFISYRRDDTEEAAVRLYERLATRLTHRLTVELRPHKQAR